MGEELSTVIGRALRNQFRIGPVLLNPPSGRHLRELVPAAHGLTGICAASRARGTFFADVICWFHVQANHGERNAGIETRCGAAGT